MANKYFQKFSMCVIFISTSTFGQQLLIERTELKEGKIMLHYSVVDSVAGKFYTVRLYGSQDNFMHPLSKTSGDVGIALRPGLHNKIVWDPTELGDQFEGSVALELRATVYVPFVHFEGFQSHRSIKRLRPYSLTWSGGSTQNVLNIELYRKNKKVHTFPNIANVGHYSILLPKHIRPGNHYKFRISDSKNKDEVVVTEKFSVRRKIPLLLKATIFIGLAGVGYVLLLPPESRSMLPFPSEPE
jgi:hypothetical protein